MLLTTEQVSASLAVVIFVLLAQVLVVGSYSSFAFDMAGHVNHHQITYILLLTAADEHHCLHVVIFAFVVQVLSNGSYSSFV